MQSADADDLTQQVLTVVVGKLPSFRHNGRTGAFRAWLRTITVHTLRSFQRSRPGPAPGGFDDMLDRLQDPASELSRQWDREHDERLMRRLLGLVEPEFQAKTWQVFRLVLLERRFAAEVAAEIGLTVKAVLIAKSRVLQRMRWETECLID